MILLDTNVISELMRPAPDLRVRAWLNDLDARALVISSVTISEIVFGLNRLSEGRRRADLMDRFNALVAGPPSLPV